VRRGRTRETRRAIQPPIGIPFAVVTPGFSVPITSWRSQARTLVRPFRSGGTLFPYCVTTGDESKMNRRRKSRRPRAISSENFAGEFTLAYLMAPLHHQANRRPAGDETNLRAASRAFNVNDARSRSALGRKARNAKTSRDVRLQRLLASATMPALTLHPSRRLSSAAFYRGARSPLAPLPATRSTRRREFIDSSSRRIERGGSNARTRGGAEMEISAGCRDTVSTPPRSLALPARCRPPARN